jgi:hypothetical protein
MQECFEPSVTQSNVLPLDAGDGADRRQYRRYPILESGLIYTADGCIDCQIVDLSASGVRVRPVRKLKEQQGTCRFLLGRLGAFEAEVCWEGKDSIGIRFGDEPETVAQRYSNLLPPDCLAAG